MKVSSLPAELTAHVVTGVAEPAVPAALALLPNRAPLTIVLATEARDASAWTSELPTITRALGLPNVEARMLPAPADAAADRDDPQAYERACDRLTLFTRLAGLSPQDNLVLFTTPAALTASAPDPQALRRRSIHLRTGTQAPFNDLVRRLGSELAYDAEAVCERPGQFSVRGGLIDVYPVNAEAPLRVDFFGDEIESIRTFDPTTQRTDATLHEALIAAFPQHEEQPRWDHLFRYLPAQVRWACVEPSALADDARPFFSQFERLPSANPSLLTLLEHRRTHHDTWLALQEFDDARAFFPDDAPSSSLFSQGLEAFRDRPLPDLFGQERAHFEKQARQRFIKTLENWRQEGTAILFTAETEEEAHHTTRFLTDEAHWPNPAVSVGPLRRGFRLDFAEQSLALVTADELFGRAAAKPALLRRRKLPRRAQIDQLLDFSELADGDTLVHLSHGVCLYRGLQRMQLSAKGKPEEVITLEFAEGLQLHLPLHEAHLLSRYVGLSKVAPRLAKLGTNNWDKSRAAAERATLDYAAHMLALQARRETIPGSPLPEDPQLNARFAETFPFRETPDQLRAIEDTLHDLARQRPSDRLICGDVGFGKTEVALRAAFQAVVAGKQVCILVPTTVLAQQHYETFRQRFAEFPVIVDMLSRFRSSAEQKVLVQRLASGAVDIVVGTHRLLSQDVAFADLGLVIVDEEHRFGVKHKERLKELREHVHVVSMSATPIPRTLYLALMGARDLSVIETPPVDRLPIQTLVKAYDPKLVQRAIRAELERGGQVFYLHNRVQTIDSVAARLSQLVPEAKLIVGHGQMGEATLERVMTRFVRGDFDILVCTTIIESGLDIPNCNTIIIEGADRFGLAQLYQLRGRVGRFKRQAYAYLLLHRHGRMLDLARQRLGAMRQHNQLGAGFKIAMRDLELRGAGNLLGSQQSGHIASVGFELYCQLLRQSIARLKGDPTASRVRASLRLDFVRVGTRGGTEEGPGANADFAALKSAEHNGAASGKLEASIPESYLDESRLRIDLYRRLALADRLDVLDRLADEIEDRFGKPPKEVRTLLAVTRLRVLAEQAHLQGVETEGDRLKCLRASGRKDDFVKIGARFPRLTARQPARRLKEIETFLVNLRHQSN